MKRTKRKNENDSAETGTITAAESLEKMKNFAERKEKIIASISKSKN
ncbi:MAG: hypothetical protein JWN60_2561 [Acidobacteria bacterium]|jgi:hypothetical protein|nr:hypothetical protein [Acidobacteriota bacterium]